MMVQDLFQKQASGKTLRPHQVRAIDLLRQSLGKGNRRVVIQGPTGFGKTLTAAKIIEGALAKGNRVIFTAPAKNLIDQTVRAFEAEGIRHIGVMQADHPRTAPTAPVQVATVQTLARRDIPAASLVIVDECHIRSAVMEKLMDDAEDVFFVGLSATPWAKGMGLRWQDLVIPCGVGDLIEQGYLSRFRVFAPDIPDMSGVKITKGDFHEGQAADVMQGAQLMGSVVETWLGKGEDRPTLVFAVNCAHAQQLQARFLAAGVSAGYCDAYTDSVERARLERQFRSGEVRVACSVRTLTTGVDWPVSCIVDAAPTRSEMLHVQKIGRGLRVNPGTEDLLVLDHAGNALRLGLITDIVYEDLDATPPGERQKRSANEKLPKPCSECEALFSGAICPECGHERKAVAGVKTADGELVEIGGTRKNPSRAERQAFFSMALWVAHERGYRPGWAGMKYREKFGVWPNRLEQVPMPPDRAFLNYEKSRRIAYAKRKAAEQEARA